MIGARVLTAQATGHDQPVVVREMGEAAQPGDVAGAVDARVGLERLRVDLQPATLGAREAGVAPGLEVRAAAGGDEQPLACH